MKYDMLPPVARVPCAISMIRKLVTAVSSNKITSAPSSGRACPVIVKNVVFAETLAQIAKIKDLKGDPLQCVFTHSATDFLTRLRPVQDTFL